VANVDEEAILEDLEMSGGECCLEFLKRFALRINDPDMWDCFFEWYDTYEWAGIEPEEEEEEKFDPDAE